MNQKLIVPVGGTDYESLDGMQVQLLSQACHFIFNDKQIKRETYMSFSGEGVVYIFDCGLDGFRSLDDKYIINRDFATMDQLLESLRHILAIGTDGDTTHPLYNKTLNTVIVDNLSVYYWDLKLLNSDPKNHEQLGYASKASGLEYYTKFISVLKEIQAKFKCNIVISSWNNTFEKGHNYSGATDCEATGLDSITFLPQKYLMEFDYLIQKSSGIDTKSRIYNKLAGQWIGIA